MEPPDLFNASTTKCDYGPVKERNILRDSDSEAFGKRSNFLITQFLVSDLGPGTSRNTIPRLQLFT